MDSYLNIDIVKSEGFQRIMEIEAFNDSEYIFEKNFEELLGVLSNYIEKQEDFKRVLHNFLMSNSTLIDHFRRLMRKCQSVSKVVNSKMVEELANSPLNNFVKDLRNYVTHFTLPLNHINFSLKNGEPVGTLVINKKELLQPDMWSKKAIEFLESTEQDIAVYETLLEHYNSIATFYNWLNEFLKREYKTDFDLDEELKKKFDIWLGY